MRYRECSARIIVVFRSQRPARIPMIAIFLLGFAAPGISIFCRAEDTPADAEEQAKKTEQQKKTDTKPIQEQPAANTTTALIPGGPRPATFADYISNAPIVVPAGKVFYPIVENGASPLANALIQSAS